jgi:hypothetical protein
MTMFHVIRLVTATVTFAPHAPDVTKALKTNLEELFGFETQQENCVS